MILKYKQKDIHLEIWLAFFGESGIIRQLKAERSGNDIIIEKDFSTFASNHTSFV
jgi:hypothetical protein